MDDTENVRFRHHHHKSEDEDTEQETYTFDEAMDQIGFGRYHMLLMQACGAGYLYDGIELSLTSFIVPLLLIEWNISLVQGGALASVVFLGMALGAYVGGMISDKFGRKIVFCGAVFIVSCFGTLSAFAPNYGTLITLRTCVGIGLGSLPPTDYSMLMEYTPRSSRGLAMGALQVYGSIGSIICCLLAWACLTEGNFAPGQGWRWLIGLSAVPGFLIFIMRLFVKESPRHMLINDRHEEARQLLTSIAHFNGKKAPRGNLVAPRPEYKLSFVEQLTGIFQRGYTRLTLLLWVIWFCLSYGGWGYSYLSPIAFDKLGTNPYLASLVYSFVALIGNILVMLFIDKFSRRPLLYVGFIITGILTSFAGINNNPYYLVIMISIVNFIATIPWSTIYVYTTESYPTSFRASGMGTCSVWYRVGATLTPIVGSSLFSTGYILPYVTFGVGLAIAGIASIFLPFETYDRNLEDVACENTLGYAVLLKTDVDEDIIRTESPDMNEQHDFDRNHEIADVDDDGYREMPDK